MFQTFVALVPGLLVATSAAAAGTCDALRSQIEAKIRTAGVASFSISVVDAASPHTGKVVGHCDAGSKKLVYQRGLSAAAAAASGASVPARRTAAPRNDSVITECKDGSVLRGGDCKK